MARPQTFIFPAAVMVSLMIAWAGTLAVSRFSLSTLSEDANNGKSPTAAVSLAQNKSPGQPKSGSEDQACSLGSKYPSQILRWCDLIDRYAEEDGLSAGLIAAVIFQESGGNPAAYSVDGAVGLMQVMPRDGLAAAFICPAGPCFSGRPSQSQLLDPEFNIAYGSGLLAGMVKRYGGLREGLKYYGPTGVGYRYADLVLRIMENHQ